MNVLDHLMEEHRTAVRLMTQLSKAKDGDRRELFEELDMALTKHMAVEEQYVYPLMAEVLGEEKAEGSETEHGLVREGMATLREMVDGDAFQAALAMVRAGVEHHVHEEESELFPKLRKKASDELAAMDPETIEAEIDDELAASGGAALASRARGDGGPTRDELYQQAQRAGIEGRSSMGKKELADAIARASRGGRR